MSVVPIPMDCRPNAYAQVPYQQPPSLADRLQKILGIPSEEEAENELRALIENCLIKDGDQQVPPLRELAALLRELAALLVKSNYEMEWAKCILTITMDVLLKYKHPVEPVFYTQALRTILYEAGLVFKKETIQYALNWCCKEATLPLFEAFFLPSDAQCPLVISSYQLTPETPPISVKIRTDIKAFIDARTYIESRKLLLQTRDCPERTFCLCCLEAFKPARHDHILSLLQILTWKERHPRWAEEDPKRKEGRENRKLAELLQKSRELYEVSEEQPELSLLLEEIRQLSDCLEEKCRPPGPPQDSAEQALFEQEKAAADESLKTLKECEKLERRRSEALLLEKKMQFSDVPGSKKKLRELKSEIHSLDRELNNACSSFDSCKEVRELFCVIEEKRKLPRLLEEVSALSDVVVEKHELSDLLRQMLGQPPFEEELFHLIEGALTSDLLPFAHLSHLRLVTLLEALAEQHCPEAYNMSLLQITQCLLSFYHSPPLRGEDQERFKKRIGRIFHQILYCGPLPFFPETVRHVFMMGCEANSPELLAAFFCRKNHETEALGLIERQEGYEQLSIRETLFNALDRKTLDAGQAFVDGDARGCVLAVKKVAKT